jgi:hypothetical protein
MSVIAACMPADLDVSQLPLLDARAPIAINTRSLGTVTALYSKR